jgi:ribosomal protein S18 acetylase RimI-like enzyme
MKYSRHIMRTDLSDRIICWKTQFQKYTWISWNESLLEPVAELIYLATASTPDAMIFPRFQTFDGCRESVRRMTIPNHLFVPGTGVIAKLSPDLKPSYHGGIIGAIFEDSIGWIQNVVVSPEAQGRGIGTLLVDKTLQMFLQHGINSVGLHVTSTNVAAIKMYHRYGFEITETIEIEPRDF